MGAATVLHHLASPVLFITLPCTNRTIRLPLRLRFCEKKLQALAAKKPFPEVQTEYPESEDSSLSSRGEDGESSEEFLLKMIHIVACIGGALFVLQHFAGINGVLYFSSLTFQDVGITSGALASLLVGWTNFGGALCIILDG